MARRPLTGMTTKEVEFGRDYETDTAPDALPYLLAADQTVGDSFN
jgi:hypothetical protein